MPYTQGAKRGPKPKNRELGNIKDSECVLIEFINENHKMSIGFQDWVVFDTGVSETNLEFYLNKNVKIKWPNVDIEPAKGMMKKTNLQWTIFVGKILALGSYNNMCAKLKNKEKFGVTTPTKQDRKVLCKKDSTTSTYSNISQDSQNRKRKFQSTMENSEKSSASTSSITRNIKKSRRTKNQIPFSPHETISSRPESYNVDDHQNKKPQPCRKKQTGNVIKQNIERKLTKLISADFGSDMYHLSDEESSDDEKRLSVEQLKTKVAILEAEIKKAKLDYRRLNVLIVVNEDLEKTANAVKNLDKIVTMTSQTFKFLNQAPSNFDSANLANTSSHSNIEKEELTDVENIIKTAQSLLSDANRIDSNLSREQSKPKAKPFFNAGQSTKENMPCIYSKKWKNTAKQSKEGSFPQENENRNLELRNTFEIGDEEIAKEVDRNLVPLGYNVFIDEEVLARAASKKLGTLISNLMNALFSAEEMATSSLSGKQVNWQTKIAPKKKLNENKTNAIKDYVKNKFPESHIIQIEQLIRQKLNNEANKFKKQRTKQNDNNGLN